MAAFHEDQNEDDACLRDTSTYKRTFGYRDMICIRNLHDAFDFDISTINMPAGSHMISSAIWNKQARVNFSKTNKIARACRASAIWGL